MPARDGYIVGESGPEVFVPTDSGEVIQLCHFCATEPRAIYRGLPICSWHLVVLYLGLHYVAKE